MTTGKTAELVDLFRVEIIYKREGDEWMKNDTVDLDGCMITAEPVFGLPDSFYLCSIGRLTVHFLWPLHFLESDHVKL